MKAEIVHTQYVELMIPFEFIHQWNIVLFV